MENQNIFSSLLSDINHPMADALKTMDLPTTRDEHWKYTRLSRLKNITFKRNSTLPIPDKLEEILATIPNYSPYRLIFVNGKLQNNLSKMPENCIFTLNSSPTLSLLENNLAPIFDTLNEVLKEDAVFIKVAKNQIIDAAISIIYIQEGQQILNNPKINIVAETGAEIEIIQHFISQDAVECFTNTSTEIQVQANAKVTLTLIQEETGKSCFHINSTKVVQEKDSHFILHNFLLGGNIVRNNIHLACVGENTQTHLYGIFIGKEDELLDNHIYLEHCASHQISKQLYKGVMDDRARGVFNGKIKIYPNAQKIEGFQSNKNILLSDQAIIDTKPELEIEANDVKCSHGTTTGQMDKNALFYLEARGISRKEAYRLLLHAFFIDCLDLVKNPIVKNYVQEKINTLFSKDTLAIA